MTRIPNDFGNENCQCSRQATGGVSLMQEGIELTEAPEEPPALVEMQEALAGPLATPICMRLGRTRGSNTGMTHTHTKDDILYTIIYILYEIYIYIYQQSMTL